MKAGDTVEVLDDHGQVVSLATLIEPSVPDYPGLCRLQQEGSTFQQWILPRRYIRPPVSRPRE